jgi:hypothetical protein
MASNLVENMSLRESVCAVEWLEALSWKRSSGLTEKLGTEAGIDHIAIA